MRVGFDYAQPTQEAYSYAGKRSLRQSRMAIRASGFKEKPVYATKVYLNQVTYLRLSIDRESGLSALESRLYVF